MSQEVNLLVRLAPFDRDGIANTRSESFAIIGLILPASIGVKTPHAGLNVQVRTGPLTGRAARS
ncbi:MAG: hypothetical protein VCC36_14250, partial [Gammaproteobacteria bacterium]